MKTSHKTGLKWLTAAAVALSAAATQAQTVDTYVGPASGGEWNTAANWSTLAPPLDATTNAVIFATTNVSYNLPMATAGFGTLNLYGTLNINTNGFNSTGIQMVVPPGGERLFINSGAVVNVSGAMQMGSNSITVMAAGASLTVGSLVVDFGTSTKSASTSIFTNNGGILNAGSTTINNNTGTSSGLMVINGGTNNLGNTAVGRNNAGAGGTALGTEGLVIYNGLVNMTNLNIGNAGQGASSLSTYVAGGVVTNYGSVSINQGTTTRFSRFVQSGGLFVVPDPGVVNPNPTIAATLNNYALLGGTNILGGFFLGNSNLLGGTINVTNSATMYIGSQGIANNGVATVTMVLNGGSTIGATAPWVGSQAMKLNGGTVTFQAADMNGAAQGITLNAALTGSGSLLETGTGGLTLGAANTYSGNTTINAGSLVLTAGGSLASARIFLAPGTTFDVSQVSGYTLAGTQTLSGSGVVTGAVTAASGATIFPGSNSVTGTLSFTNGLTENGGVVNQFNLSSNPLGPNNDFMIVNGGLNLSGANTVLISGAVNNGSAYPIINYGGGLTGGIANLSVSGATGILSNSVAGSTIYFIAQSTVRTATNVLWVGNPVNNNWDTATTTNWINPSAQLDTFLVGDTAIFGKQGSTNPVVNIPATVAPAAVVVNFPTNYVFSGVGAVAGGGGLTVSNNGNLNVLTANSYSGPTVLVAGGKLTTPSLANGGSASGIGADSSDPSSLILNGGVLGYYGATLGIDRGLTLTNGGGTIDVTNGTTLTLNGSVIGNGGLTLVGAGGLTLTSANSYSGTTTISNGTLTLNNIAGAGTGGITLVGSTLSLTTPSQVTYANNLTVLANSTLNSAGGNNNILTGTWTGGTNVTLNVVLNGTGGTFSAAGNMTNFYGTVELGNDAGTFRLNGGNSNTQFGGPNTTFDLGSNNVAFVARNPGTMTIGAIAGGPSTIIKGPTSIVGALIWQIGSSTNNPNSIYYGTIQDNAGNENVSVTKVGNGTLVLAGQNTYTGPTTVNSGKLVLTNNPFTLLDGSVDNSATINILQGAGLDVSARSDGTLQEGVSATQFVQGSGTIYGSLNESTFGFVSPGGGITGNTGTLTVTNNVTLSGVTWMKLSRGNTPNSDRIVSSHGSITYGSALIVTNIGYNLQVNDTFTLFSGNGLSAGTFSAIVLPTTYYTWDTSQLGVNGTIRVTAVAPIPALANVDFSQLANGQITLKASHGAAGGVVNVLTTTNLSLPLSSWSVLTTSSFDGSGNLNLPITVNPTAPQSFYVLQGQ